MSFGRGYHRRSAQRKNVGRSKLRVGLIGCGWVSAYHLAAWEAHADRASVVALVDPSPESLARRGGEHGINARFESAADMLAEVELDVVDIASPRETHVELVRLTAQHGLAVLCQKPLAPRLEEAEALADEVEPMVPVMVHENWRFRPYIRDIKAWLDRGVIGPVEQVLVELFYSGLIRGPTGEFPAVKRQPFFGVVDRLLVMEILIHHVDSLRYLFGDLSVEAAHVQYAVPEVPGETNAAVFLSAEADRGSGLIRIPLVLLANMAAHGYPERSPDRFRIFGRQGTISLRDGVLTRCGRDAESKAYDLVTAYTASYVASVGHFLDGLANGGTFETSLQDNLKTLRLIEAIYSGGTR